MIKCSQCNNQINDQAYIKDGKPFCSEACREKYKIDTLVTIKITSDIHIKCGCGHPIISHKYDSAGWNCDGMNCSCPMTPGAIIKELYDKGKISIV